MSPRLRALPRSTAAGPRGLLPRLALCALALPGFAHAQADFTEGFDNLGPFVDKQLGPQALIDRGWTFRNQSVPNDPSWTWREGPYHLSGCGWDTFAPQAGAGYLGSDAKSAGWWGGQTNNWAILPVVPNQVAGDVISVYAKQELNTAQTVLEVRYSPSGGLDTGSTVTDVGDFTDVLISIHPPVQGAWKFYSASIPGTGRLALRFSTTESVNGCVIATGFDTLKIGPSSGPCDGYPTVPGPGETVAWTLADSPHRICTHTVIPATAKVVVEPGAEVLLDAGAALHVAGELEVLPGARVDVPYEASVFVYGQAAFLGTPSQQVSLTGGPRSSYPFAPERIAAMNGGTIVAEHVTLKTTLSALGTGIALTENLHVTGAGNGFYGSGEDLLYGGTITVRDSVFGQDTEIWTVGSYLYLEGCTFNGGIFRPGRPRTGQTLLLDGLVARNRASDSVFQLFGGDFFFGPDNTIVGNGYTVMLEGGGIAPGSTLPASGNTNDVVHVAGAAAEGRVHWSLAGIPYLVESGGIVGGELTVDPGVRVLMGPGAAIFSLYAGGLFLEGLPEAPIVFERQYPGIAWDILAFVALSDRRKIEHTVLQGGTRAITADLATVHVESCRIEGNQQVGLDSLNEGKIYARGSRILGNGIGARTGSFGTSWPLDLDADGNVNVIEGNGIGVQTLGNPYYADEARGNYWGDPSGPQHPDNPGGQGDSAVGYNFVVPFETAPPPDNSPPVVRLERHSDLMEEGAKVLLHWTASDDDRITGYRILYSPHGEDPELYVLAEGIPGTARSWEVVVPEAPPDNNYPRESSIRVEATDRFGQTGWDHIYFRTPWLHDYFGGFQPNDVVGVLRPGQPYELCGQYFGAGGPSGVEIRLRLDGDDQEHPYGAGPFGECWGYEMELPPFSTDLARWVSIHTGGAGGRITYSFSDYFEIRPDPRIGDEPPQIALVSPVAGTAFDGGQVVVLQWTASDDEGLRSFDIHASTDDGRTWSTVTHGLEPHVRMYGWKLPPSAGIDAVKVRVVARDLRFQNSSATSGTFSILPGPNTGGFHKNL